MRVFKDTEQKYSSSILRSLHSSVNQRLLIHTFIKHSTNLLSVNCYVLGLCKISNTYMVYYCST